jgi:hypothetical protein
LKGDDKDMHRLSSAVGRNLKQQGDILKAINEQKEFNQNVMQTLQSITEKFSTGNQAQSADISKLNEDLQNEILSGNVVGALDAYYNLRTDAEKNVSQANQNKVNQLLDGLKEEPFWVDLEPHVRDSAMKYVQSGKDPETAVQIAYQKHRGDYLGGLVATIHSTNPDALKMAKGGGKPPKEEGNKGKLPPEFKKRAAKDIAEGLFKDEKEWIESLAPAIRKQLGV